MKFKSLPLFVLLLSSISFAGDVVTTSSTGFFGRTFAPKIERKLNRFLNKLDIHSQVYLEYPASNKTCSVSVTKDLLNFVKATNRSDRDALKKKYQDITVISVEKTNPTFFRKRTRHVLYTHVNSFPMSPNLGFPYDHNQILVKEIGYNETTSGVTAVAKATYADTALRLDPQATEIETTTVLHYTPNYYAYISINHIDSEQYRQALKYGDIYVGKSEKKTEYDCAPLTLE